MNRYPRALLVSALLLTVVPVGAGAAPAGRTTLDATIVAAGERDLEVGPGEERVTRTLGWDDPGGTGRPLAAFKHVSDIHVLDEESPGRIEYFDNCPDLPGHSSAYRPQEPLTAQIGEAMLRALARIDDGPATGAPFTSVVSTGDNTDNNQRNELRWFIRLLDGATVTPDSGAPGYEGFTREQTTTALDDETLALAQQAFDSTGAQLPWYAVLGNHDGLVQGTAPSNDTFQGLVTGDRKVFADRDAYDDCPANAQEAADKAIFAFFTRGRHVTKDPARRFLSHEEIVASYFRTTGAPEGHGLARAPQDPMHGSRAGYYAWPVGRRVLGISLDTIGYHGGSNGSLTDPQFRWLQRKLKGASSAYYAPDGTLRTNPKATDRLVLLFSHHTSLTLDNPGTDPAGAPYHCFRKTDPAQVEGTCGDGEGLSELIDRFPNVVAWVNGHEHNNAIRAYESESGDPARGFWEINTAAHIDWPQQSRLIEIAWRPGAGGDTVLIYGTMVDHAAAPDPDPAAALPLYLASVARVEAYYDACVRTGQATCEAPGAPGDRNVRLVSKAPFDLGN